MVEPEAAMDTLVSVASNATGSSEGDKSEGATAAAVSFEPFFQRRKPPKRRRPKRTAAAAPSTVPRPPESFADDSAFQIQPYYYEPSPAKKKAGTASRTTATEEEADPAPPHSVLSLLVEREMFGARNTLRRGGFKDYVGKRKRIIKFTELGTSADTAVLGLDRTGSYLVALGATDANALALKMFGVPSPSVVGRRAPLLLSVPLEYKAAATAATGTNRSRSNAEDFDDSNNDENNDWLLFAQPSPVQTAVRIWLCSSGSLGIGMYRDTNNSSANQKQPVHVVLFRPPRAQTESTMQQYQSEWRTQNDEIAWKLHNVHAPSQMAQDANPSKDCNMLWQIGYYPNSKTSSEEMSGLCDSVMEGPSFLFLIDEEDGYRLTWITDSGWNEQELKHRHVEPLWSGHENGAGKKRKQPVVRSTRDTHIVVPVTRVDAGWERFNNTSGLFEVPNDEKNESGKNNILQNNHLDIAFTAFFSATALLHSILTRRPNLVQPRFDSSCARTPNYAYHFIGLSKGGRSAEILLVFSVGPIGKGCIGIFLEVDLLTSDYREQEFIRHAHYDSPPSTCANLALERRYLSSRSGECESSSIAIKNDGVSKMLPILYPDCETIDNVAVRRQKPVWCMKAHDAPVEIVYG